MFCPRVLIFTKTFTQGQYVNNSEYIVNGCKNNEYEFVISIVEWNVPVLTIVVEGDLDTIEAVNKVLQQDLPILIIKGSGKAADFIAEFIEHDTIKISEYIKDKTPLLFGISSHDLMNREFVGKDSGSQKHQRNDLQSNMKAIKQNKCLVSSQSYYSTSIDDKQFSSPTAVSINAISGTLRADNRKFMNSYKEILTPSSLPLYYYIAYQFIQEMQAEKKVKIENFNMLLKEAIVADRDEYVSVLLEEEGVHFDDKYFPDIYKETIQSQRKAKTALKNVFKWGSSPVIKQFKELCFHTKDKQDKQVDQLTPTEVCMIAGRQICQSLLEYPRYNSLNRQEKCSPYQDLLIWAIFVNRPKLATIFWMKCEQPLLCALLASSVYKRMAASATDQATKSDMIAQSRLFADRALDLQSRLYDDDAELAMDLVITERIVWDITLSPMQCAYEHDMLDVLAQTCPQRRLNRIWYSGISSSLGGFWKKGLSYGLCCCRKTTSPDKGLIKLIGAPLTRFLLHFVFFFAAMNSGSIFLMQMNVYKDIRSIGVFEMIFYVHLAGDILEEYRNMISKEVLMKMCKRTSAQENTLSHSPWYRFKKYICDFWNLLDVISYTLIITAICFRFFLLSDGWQKFSRRFFSLSLSTTYIRSFRVLLMSRFLGPKIIMIKEMIKDLFRFIGILFLCMLGVGVMYHANMYPEHDLKMSKIGNYHHWRIWKIISIPYWQIYGETMLASLQENITSPCTMTRSVWESDTEIERCNQYDWVLIVIAAIYMLISNLLLVNLLIALFSYRFERVQEISEKIWRYLRYEVIMDYRTRIPAPFNLVIRPIYIVYWCCTQIKKTQSDEKANIHKRSLDRINELQSTNAIKCVYNI
ncbi:transient receptor potential cation channel subfamily M member-like 2 [Mytilus trossulus]|uniref:transient receptor potential cation channel subfamily M member-like 2 n=1 Tax=Mytilus trossulus TaxID=6551 RepID=UPI003006D9D0